MDLSGELKLDRYASVKLMRFTVLADEVAGRETTHTAH